MLNQLAESIVILEDVFQSHLLYNLFIALLQ